MPTPDSTAATIDAARITEVAIRAAREAGEIALAGFRSPELRVERKSSMHDPVTAYDRACEERIRAVILEACPDATIVGEEAGATHGSGPLTWYVDPIDGTSNFARGIAMWAVSIGVARGGDLVAGVIFDPVADQLFWADDRGAFLRDGRAPEVDLPLRSRGNTEPDAATVVLNFPLPRDLVHDPARSLEQFAAATRSFAQLRAIGSTCIALAWIAAGWVDATISFETNPWDVAAGALIIRRAGGVFQGYAAGGIAPAERAHLAPHYFASVPGGEVRGGEARDGEARDSEAQGGAFALLHEIMRTQSRLRP